jgi:hypothetical protein
MQIFLKSYIWRAYVKIYSFIKNNFFKYYIGLNKNNCKSIIKKAVSLKNYNSNTSNLWNVYLNKIKFSLLTKDITKFLQWPEIISSMVRADNKFTKIQLNKIQNLTLKYGKKIIEEKFVGFPRYSVYKLNSSANLIHHAYHLSIFERYTKKNILDHDLIIEFGGGYGSMCRLIKNMGYEGSYVIYDLKHLNLLQEYFLSNIFLNQNNNIKNLSIKKKIIITSSVSIVNKIFNSYKNVLFISNWAYEESSYNTQKKFKKYLTKSKSLLIGFSRYFVEDNKDYLNYFTKIIYNRNYVLKKAPYTRHSYYLVK